MINAAKHDYGQNRLFEWVSSVMMVLMAFTLALPGDTLARPALHALTDMGLSEPSIATIFATIGVLRATALVLNGHINNGRAWPNGANIRALCAIVSCLVWSQISVALFWDSVQTGLPSLFLPMIGTFAGAEAISCYVARMDAVDRTSRLGNAIADLTEGRAR